MRGWRLAVWRMPEEGTEVEGGVVGFSYGVDSMGEWERGVKGEGGGELQEICLTYMGTGLIGRMGPIF